MQHPADDDLALLALGETVPPAAAHVDSCAVCRRELAALAAAVRTAREADLELARPPAAVWERVRQELGLAEHGPAPLRRRRRPLLAGAAAALTAAAAAVVVLVGLGGTQAPGPVEGPAVPLLALGPVQATGRVALADSPERRALRVETAGLPRPDGLYEVWLLDVESGRMVALGALDDSGNGWLTVPTGVDLGDYPEVDVSLEPADGDPAHSGNSLLRGDLPA